MRLALLSPVAFLTVFLEFLLFVWHEFFSPFLGVACCYYPSCSCYARECLKKHGLFKGSLLAMRRVCRCHQGARGGFDPVPD